jgi:ubiquitin-conjugating enzyme E2 Z
VTKDELRCKTLVFRIFFNGNAVTVIAHGNSCGRNGDIQMLHKVAGLLLGQADTVIQSVHQDLVKYFEECRIHGNGFPDHGLSRLVPDPAIISVGVVASHIGIRALENMLTLGKFHVLTIGWCGHGKGGKKRRCTQAGKRGPLVNFLPSADYKFEARYPYLNYESKMSTAWDPLAILDGLNPNPRYLNRRMKEILSFTEDPVPGVQVQQDEFKAALVHAIIEGPEGTPYEGGFFYFILVYPNDYPVNPFKVKFMTTGGGKVRFNPNLYNCGKLCLSILGTWTGPEWSSVYTIRTTLLSIQTILNEAPLCNEPGYNRSAKEKIDAYNNVVRHETMRVAIVGAAEEALVELAKPVSTEPPNTIKLPRELHEHVLRRFAKNYDKYIEICEKHRLADGTYFESSFGGNHGVFNYGKLLDRLTVIKVRLDV